MRVVAVTSLVLVISMSTLPPASLPAAQPPVQAPQALYRGRWTEVNPDADWAPRAGLQVVELHNTFYLMGGRTPIDPAVLPVPGASIIWSDVWSSGDRETFNFADPSNYLRVDNDVWRFSPWPGRWR